MKNSIGHLFNVSVFGESHGECIGCVIDGLSAGIKLDLDFINAQMNKRKAKGKISTQRQEGDEIKIVSGYFEGYTTGTPLTIIIENTNKRSDDYTQHKNRLRPSHADYTADVKYLGYQDYRGGGHFSGRLTAPLVAAGAIAMQILQQKGIQIGTHIANLNGILDQSFSDDEERLIKQIDICNQRDFAVLDEMIGNIMQMRIEQCAKDGDSVGGILETAIMNVPAGIGEPMFDSIESRLAHLLFSVPAIKGVEFGIGFHFANLTGSQANDALYYDGKVKTKTNNNGGINGGISNGMPIIIRSVVKPTPSIFKPQETIDKESKESVQLQIQGRHDPAIIHRARVVVDSVIALGLLDLMLEQEAYHVMR